MQDISKTVHSSARTVDEAQRGAALDIAASAFLALGCNAVAVYLYDEAAGAYVWSAGAPQGLSLPGSLLPEDAVSAAISPGAVTGWVNDAQALSGALGDEARRIAGSSLLVVRCDRGNRALGVLLCAYDDGDAFDALREAEAESFARLAGTALDYARKAKAAVDRAERLTSLLDSAAAFAGELDLESLFTAIHEQVRRLMDAPAFIIALEDAQTGLLLTEYIVDAGMRVHVEAVPAESGVARDVYDTGQPVVLESAQMYGTAQPSIAANGRRVESALIVPMRRKERTIGVMSVQSYRTGAYGSDEVQLLLDVAEQAASAIQNAGVFREERQRMSELAVLHRLAALTNSEAHLDRIMAAIVAEAAEVFHVDAVSIALENERGDFRLVATHGVSPDYQHHRVIRGSVLRALYGTPPTERFIGPDRLDSMGQEELVKAEGITNWFLVPLVQQGRLVGSLALCGRDKSVCLSPTETHLAQLFADQAAAAMIRAQSAHALTERIEDYDLLTRVGRALVSRLDVDYQGILQLLHEQLGYTHLAIFALEGDPPKLNLKSHLGHTDGAATHALSTESGVVGSVAARGEMLYLPDVTRDARYVPAAPDVRSEIAYPLKFGGQVLGVLDVESVMTDAFTARDRRILAALADQCAIALSNARQFTTASARLDSLSAARAQLEQYAQYLERRQEELKLVNAVSAATSATLNLDRMLSSAVRSVAEGLHADRCSIGILDEDQRRIQVAAEYRTDGHPTNPGVKLPLAPESILTRVVSERRTLASDDAPYDSRFADVRAEMLDMQVRGTVVVPLVAGERVIGTLSVNSSREARHFTADEIAVLETVANQLALGVRNARLYGRAKDRANEDSLTGLFNHRYLHERLEFELARARRANQPLAIALFDLNNFKTFNDTFGHQAGDEVLRVVAATLDMCLRGTDAAGRYGGDEFLVVLPQAQEAGAQMLLDRVKNKLEEQSRAGFPPIPIELSAGIAVFPRDGTNKRELIAYADQAMYAKKRTKYAATG